MLKELSNLILNILFPLSCLGCKKSNTLLCPQCQTKMQVGQLQILTRPTANLDHLLICQDYGNDIIKVCIKAYKFNSLKSLAKPMAKLMIDCLTEAGWDRIDCLLPIPLHKRKLNRRGFNQSEQLAQIMAKQLDIKIYYRLKRVIYTPPQAKLDRRTRLRNISGAFRYLDEIAPPRVLLIDDVATTLSTLNCAAKELKKHGSKQVDAIVIARNV